MDLIENPMFNEIILVSIAILIIVLVVNTIFYTFQKHSKNTEQDQTQIQTRNKIWSSIWFWWFLTTVIYIVFNFSGYPSSTTSLLGYVAGFVGLFFPYGWASSILLILSPFSWISVVVFLILMFMAEKELNRKNYGLRKRILINFLILLFLTTAVDLIRGTFFQSWFIFLSGAFPSHMGY